MKIVAGVLGVVMALSGVASIAAQTPSAPLSVQPGKSDVDPLKSKIACFVSMGILKPTCAALLNSTLTAAQKRADQGNFDGAIALINSFITTVNRYETAGQLPCWAANCLRWMALDLISLWGEGQGG